MVEEVIMMGGYVPDCDGCGVELTKMMLEKKFNKLDGQFVRESCTRSGNVPYSYLCWLWQCSAVYIVQIILVQC